MVGKTSLKGLEPQVWEHPADRLALQALRAVPGFDELLRSIAGVLGERGVRLIFQANAVRVGPRQHPRVHAVYQDVLATLDCEARPELFMAQTPVVNAGAYGIDEPFIVLNSGALELLDDDELGFVVGHELGHVLSGHALYHTMLRLILWVGQSAAPSLLGLVRLPLQIALLEWYRKSELSCDRAGLLAIQKPEAATRGLLKLAGGGRAEELDVAAFLEQGREYQDAGSVVDRVFKILNTIGRTHPFHAPRAAELDHWARSGDYERILRGEYGASAEARPASAGVADVAAHYAGDLRAVTAEVASSAQKVANAARDAVQSFSAAMRSKR